MEWNEERIATLTRLWREGYSASQVAGQLGEVSRSAVIGKVHRLGLAGRDAPSRPQSLGGQPPSNRNRATPGGVRRVRPSQLHPTEATAPRGVFEATPTATLVTLTDHGCRWPIGDPGMAGFGFCGRLKASGGVYCAGHAPMSVRRRAPPIRPAEIERLVSRYVEGGAFARWADRA
jgi:GcrA cell cycle regulator